MICKTNIPIIKITSGGGGGGGGWVRPADRLAKPTIADNEVYWLFGVSENSPNDFAVIGASDGTDYTIDWGDGTSSVVANNVKAEKQFDYTDTYFQGLTADSRGYKQVWIKMRPTNVGENLKTVNIDTRPSWRPTSTSHIFEPQVLELYIRASELTSLNFGSSSVYNRYTMCDVFGLQENSLSSCNYMLQYFMALRKIDDLNINDIGSLSNFMNYCYSYNQPFPSGITFANVTSYFMRYCFAYNQPFPSSVTFANANGNFMSDCYSYNQPFPSSVTFANVTYDFMNACRAYNQPFPSSVTFANVTYNFMNACRAYNQPFTSSVTFANVTYKFMDSCYSYNQPFPSSVTFANVTYDFMRNCYSYNQPLTVAFSLTNTNSHSGFISNSNYAMKYLRVNNWNSQFSSISIQNGSYSADSLALLFGDLYDRTSTTAGAINITNCYGASLLTAAQKQIATDKNWVITGA